MNNHDFAPFVLPDLRHAHWVHANLDELAGATVAGISPNPLVDPVLCDEWLTDRTRELNADYTWGGYGENRSRLWRDHYLPPGCYIHLGVDLNAPAGTRVCAPADCKVVFSEPNTALGGGWGGWVVLELQGIPRPDGITHLLYGHLAHITLPETGCFIQKGGDVGYIGENHENGGWFPHLHAQALTVDAWNMWKNRMPELDGYAPALSALFPDPGPLLGLPSLR